MDVAEIFLRPTRYFPSRIAVAAEDGERQLTYKEFHEESVRLAIKLGKLGMKRGERVGVLSLNRTRYLSIYFACSLSRFVVVPLNFRLSPSGK
jgi:acyl-CoA synthetase (AMP-forming)/AMP-acid ligase II